MVQKLEEMKAGTIIIRSHGVGPQVYRQAEKAGLSMVDAWLSESDGIGLVSLHDLTLCVVGAPLSALFCYNRRRFFSVR